ncbi:MULTISPECIES: hypothetical protein [Bacillus]|uniref:hypothetical protein n=1 Tax=Bacillus TaxID=1386 RepID=UPI00061A1660|nr:hypothetical protein [Bacillus altitudinis]MCA0926154.1 hypothetical protein [Bacillus stratosphericus]MDH8711697.1 ABC-2 type transport system permease protein [Micromonospora sp. 1209]AKC64844.1 hypothetical protein VT48_01895 [Bacillus altitudinis]AKU31206.1 hypothetical protein ID12_07090 [Bacillus altitudinis]APP14644.1 hypothetical protein BS467_02315 [Bacillus altitudinis]
MHKYLTYTKILLINDFRRHQRNNALIFVLFSFLYIISPLFLGVLATYFIKGLPTIYLSFLILMLTVNIDKSLMRILFSSDKKQMAILKIHLDQYIFGKDMSKFFSIIVGLLFFFLGSYLTNLSINVYNQPFTLAALGITSFVLGYLLRLHLLFLLSNPRFFTISSSIGYITTGLILLWVFTVFKFNLLTTSLSSYSIYIIFIFSFISLLLVINWRKNIHNIPIFHFQKKTKAKQKETSRNFNHLLFYELTLLMRNPPIQWSVSLFILTLSGGLLGLILYGVNTRQLETLNIDNDFLFIFCVIFPMIILSNAIQSYVSFDIDGPILPLKQKLPNFTKNKIKTKMVLSIIIHLFFCIIYALFSSFTIYLDKPMFVIISLINCSILIAICTVSSTVLFPYFKWEYVYQIPSSLSKLTLNICYSFILGLAVISSYSTIYFIVTNAIMAASSIIIISLIFTYWHRTINKNYKSFKTLFE